MIWLLMSALALADIIPDPEDFEFVPDHGDCTVEKKCEGRPGRSCESDSEACTQAPGWSRMCESLGVVVYCWNNIGNPIDRCGKLVTLDVGATMGSLEPSQLTCLDNMASDTQALQRVEASRILLRYATKVGDGASWERYATRHALQLEPNKPDLAYALAQAAAAKEVPDHVAVLSWSAQALQHAKAWPQDQARDKSLTLRQLQARSALALSQATTPPDPGLVTQARALARTWYQAEIKAGNPAAEPLKVCLAAGAEAAWCKHEGAWAE